MTSNQIFRWALENATVGKAAFSRIIQRERCVSEATVNKWAAENDESMRENDIGRFLSFASLCWHYSKPAFYLLKDAVEYLETKLMNGTSPEVQIKPFSASELALRMQELLLALMRHQMAVARDDEYRMLCAQVRALGAEFAERLNHDKVMSEAAIMQKQVAAVGGFRPNGLRGLDTPWRS